MAIKTGRIAVLRAKRKRNSIITDTFQLIILGGGLIWLLMRGAAEMH